MTPVKRTLFALLLTTSLVIPVAACAPQSTSTHPAAHVSTAPHTDEIAIHQSVSVIRAARAEAQAKAAAEAQAKAAAEAQAKAAAEAQAKAAAQAWAAAQAKPKPASAPVRKVSSSSPASGSIRGMIAQVFGPDAGKATRVAMCESTLNPNARNASGASGLFQFLPSTWRGTPYAGSSPFNAWANINAAHWLYLRDGHSWREWQCGGA